ncbi:hypothetical protein CQ018_17565 [Arthrobacter sp. MYb227]|uniref:SH3 domain-containing protein n=1 Tax=Arthrobacter sp. MYb227 TaxID=1848601 RepID=UPI000CFD1521|nr:SH3 domain-containing protein [Arthrobacter sp. MYb227]PQZ87751.1 hypothetical protein CQ018_17565 [Arthrobacter sp. MYb227]
MKKHDFARTSPQSLPLDVRGPTHQTTAELKLRKGAGRHYATQQIIPALSSVYLLRINGLWASVQFGQVFGWLPVQCLERIMLVPQAIPVISTAERSAKSEKSTFSSRSAPSPAEVLEAEFVPDHRTTADLNLRKGSGTNYPVQQVLPGSMMVRKLEESGTWTKISTGRHIGWVPAAYLEPVAVKRKASGIQEQDISECTTTVRLNVRSGAGDHYPVLRILQAGTLVRVNATLGDWRRVILEGIQGWVPASQLVERHVSSGVLHTVIETTLYQGASANYRALVHIKPGERVEVIGAKGPWAKVRYGRFEGWINTNATDEGAR